MSRTTKVILVAAAIALVYGLYAAGTRAYSWMKGPEPGSRPWQVQQFRKDWRACSQFAHKREEARKLLAWTPQPPWVNPPGSDGWKKEWEARLAQDAAESEARMKNLDAEMKAMAARWNADELACLGDLDWPDIQIESLRKEVLAEDEKKRRF
jgi:hypothetical protein